MSGPAGVSSCSLLRILAEIVDPMGPTVSEFHVAPMNKYFGPSKSMSLISRRDDSIGS